MWVDVFIVLAVILAVYRGWGRGLVSQLAGTIGFIIGIFIGRLLEPHTVLLVHSPMARVVVTIATILGMALIFMSLGEQIGFKLKHRMNNEVVNNVDNGLGLVLTCAAVLISIWLLSAIITKLPGLNPSIQAQIQTSKIMRELNHELPPSSTVLADFSHLINPNGFPDVFIGGEPIPRSVTLPSLGQMNSAVLADKNSVLRIQGQGCGGIVSGSGFVVGDGLVATNAHVVAGIQHPVAEDVNGNHPATVIWFDPNLDFAVLKVSGLAGQPLTFNTKTASSGTAAAVLGYPGGGGFNPVAAAVVSEFTAVGHNIYGQGQTNRNIYSIKANVIPGNSGGPLVGQDGRVLGVVFAQSTSYQNLGYALTAASAQKEVQQASVNQQAVSTGTCAE